jgi:hypothetical protein
MLQQITFYRLRKVSSFLLWYSTRTSYLRVMIECHSMHAPFKSLFIRNFLTVNKVNQRVNFICRSAAILLCYVLGAPLFLLPQCATPIKSQSSV